MSPQTEAGRALVEDEPRVVIGEHDMRTRVLAIEAQARAAALDEAVAAVEALVMFDTSFTPGGPFVSRSAVLEALRGTRA